jgi:hypothetical protein
MAMRLLVANGKDGGWRPHPALVAGGVYGRRSDHVKKRAGGRVAVGGTAALSTFLDEVIPA